MDFSNSMLLSEDVSAKRPEMAFDKSSALVNYFDSGWVLDNNATNHRTSISHAMGAAPRFVQIFFSPGGDSSAVYPITWSWAANYSGNPVTVEVTTEHINLHIWNGAPLHGIWDGASGQWRLFGHGYWRVFAWR